MNEFEDKLKNSVELAKTGFENAQARITAIDTKVSIAVGLLIVLLPVPLAIASWLIGLEKTTAANIYTVCSHRWLLSSGVAAFLLAGMCCAFIAILCGISCLIPRAPKGYGECGPFRNEWKPNILFPLHKPDKAEEFCAHLRRLEEGVNASFIISEYDHQLQQLGRILDSKFSAMNQCFQWLNRCLFCYGIAILIAAIIALSMFLRSQ